jgi:hypothetical protein
VRNRATIQCMFPMIHRSVPTAFSNCLMAVCTALLLPLLAWSQSLEVIDLHHRTAAEVIPVLQPLVESGGALSGQDYQLFVRVSSANLAQLKKALASLDRAPKALVISVRNSTREDIARETAAAHAEVDPRHSSVSVQGTSSNGSRDSSGVSTVRVLEGGTASIATGQSIPVVTSYAVGGGRRPFAAGSLEYRNLNSGFLVTPRLAGQQVTLQIDQQSQQPQSSREPDSRGGVVNTQSLSTQVSGRLGEWIALGAVNESSSSSSSGILTRHYETQSSDRTLWVRIELAD